MKSHITLKAMTSLPFRVLLRQCFLIYLVTQILFLIYIQFPRTPNFDEFHYIPSAKQFLALAENQNWEHPPLGKMILAVGIGLFGDQPIGWRVMSTFFGALTVVGMYLWGLAAFRREDLAGWTVLFTLTNGMTYVMSRIGMLDPFMTAFIVFGMAFFTEVYQLGLQQEDRGGLLARRLLIASGVCFALATACKWFGLMPWVLCGGWAGLFWLFRKWKVEFKTPSPAPEEKEFYSPSVFSQFKREDWLIGFIAIPLVFYFATFLPYYFLNYTHLEKKPGLFGLLAMQYQMFDGQLRVTTSHPYMSIWQGWPFAIRPIWFAFDKEGAAKEFVRGVLMVGNPALMWGGLIALLAIFVNWVKTRSATGFIILVSYLGLYLSWAFIPRKISFYYYYYPAALVLSLAMAQTIALIQKKWGPTDEQDRFAASVAKWIIVGSIVLMFGFFFPIYAAIKIPSESFRMWTWFNSWV